MPSVPITLSPRIRKMFDTGKLTEQFKMINLDAGNFLVGKITNRATGETFQNKNAPFRAGFGPWKGRGNYRTKQYAPYVDWYAEEKKARGERYWHKSSGALWDDAIENPIIKSTRMSVSLRVRPGKSSAYAAVQQYGNPAWRNGPKARPYYQLAPQDMKKLSIWYQNKLVQAFGGSEARYGKI